MDEVTQTVLKVCAVKLVDVRKVQGLDSEITSGENVPAEDGASDHESNTTDFISSIPDKSSRPDGDQQTLLSRVKMSSVRLVDCRKIRNRKATAEGDAEDETFGHESKNDDFVPSRKTRKFDRDQQTLEAQLKMCLVKMVDCGKIQNRKETAEDESSQSSSDQEYENTSRERTSKRNFPRKVKSVKSSYALRLSAKQIVHSKGQMVYQCSRCGRGFSSSLDFGRHQNVHVEEKNYHCTQCGKKFAQRSQLRRHQGVHAGEKPYQCT